MRHGMRFFTIRLGVSPRQWTALITLALLCSFHATASDRVERPQSLTFSSIQGSLNSEISFAVLKEAYQQLGIQIQNKPLPGERALKSSNSGQSDGEMFRIQHIEKKYPQLIPVSVPINQLEGVAFAKRPLQLENGWQSLSQYNFGIRKGIKFCERNTVGMKKVVVNSNEQLIKLLHAGRIDIAVLAMSNGLKTIQALGFDGIIALKPNLETYPLYHYLHQKHRELIPALENALREMESNGRISEIRQGFLNNIKN